MPTAWLHLRAEPLRVNAVAATDIQNRARFGQPIVEQTVTVEQFVAIGDGSGHGERIKD